MSTFKRFPENATSVASNTAIASSPIAEPYSVPGDVPRGKGRMLIFGFIVAFFIGCLFTVWDSFYRYDAYGIVDANIIGVYATNPGKIETLLVAQGDDLFTSQHVATVSNSELTRELSRVKDKLNITISKIDAKTSEIAWTRASNNDDFFTSSADMLLLEGKLAEYRIRLQVAETNVSRARRLAKTGSISKREVDDFVADRDTFIELIKATEQSVLKMKIGLVDNRSAIADTGMIQIKPLIETVAFIKNEIVRLQEKIDEGIITSPVTGRVSNILIHSGEIVESKPIFNIVEDNTTNVVLYFESDRVLPSIGDTIQVNIISTNELLDLVVIGFARDAVEAPSQIRKYYNENEKLIRIFLEPVDFNADRLIVGSVVLKTIL
jgi:multidrug resistance efflux pump